MCWEQSHTTGTDLYPFSLHLWLFTSALSFPRLWSTLRYAPSHPESHRERPCSSVSLGKSKVITEVNHWTLLNPWGVEPRFKKQCILAKMQKRDRGKKLCLVPPNTRWSVYDRQTATEVFIHDWQQLLLVCRDKSSPCSWNRLATSSSLEHSSNCSRTNPGFSALILPQLFCMSLIILCKPAARSSNEKNNALLHWDRLTIKVLTNVK